MSSRSSHWLGSSGYHGSKLNLFKQVTGIDLGHVLFDRLSQVDGPITGRSDAVLHATVAPMPYDELGPLKDIIDRHHLKKDMMWVDKGPMDTEVVHMQGRIGKQAVEDLPFQLKELSASSLRPVVVVGSAEAAPVVEILMSDKVARTGNVVGIALNGHSMQHNPNVVYVRELNDKPSAASNTEKHDYLEYYKD